jgi:hypothetical protein
MTMSDEAFQAAVLALLGALLAVAMIQAWGGWRR